MDHDTSDSASYMLHKLKFYSTDHVIQPYTQNFTRISTSNLRFYSTDLGRLTILLWAVEMLANHRYVYKKMNS